MNLAEAVKRIEDLDRGAIEKSKERWLSVAKPLFSLGKFEELITSIAGIKGREFYSLDKKALLIMCADNGVVEEGVTQTRQEITAVVTGNFAQRVSSVCKMSEIAGVDIFPVDIGVAVDVDGVTDNNIKVAYGTKNITKEPAMTKDETIKAIEVGINKVIELKELGYDIIATGEMGIGNTTTSSALASVLLDLPVEDVTGRGAGLSSKGLQKKIDTIKRAINVNKPDKNDVIDVLSKIGGLDIAGITGIFIGGSVCHIPIVIDGFISGISAVIASKICPKVRQYILPSHVSKEPAGHIVLDELGLSPIINADMCLGEGTGAVALFPLLDMSYAVYSKVNTFQQWNGNETYKVLK